MNERMNELSINSHLFTHPLLLTPRTRSLTQHKTLTHSFILITDTSLTHTIHWQLNLCLYSLILSTFLGRLLCDPLAQTHIFMHSLKKYMSFLLCAMRYTNTHFQSFGNPYSSYHHTAWRVPWLPGSHQCHPQHTFYQGWFSWNWWQLEQEKFRMWRCHRYFLNSPFQTASKGSPAGSLYYNIGHLWLLMNQRYFRAIRCNCYLMLHLQLWLFFN